MVKPFHVKKLLAQAFDLSGLNRIMQYSQVQLFSPFIRAIYGHDVPPSEEEQFEQQLHFYGKHFAAVTYEDLHDLHHNRWQKEKPGLIVSFDDGLRSSYEVVAPLLEEHGFTGWFFISPWLIDTPVDEQTQRATEHRVFPKRFDYGSPRVFLTWDQIRELSRKHVVGCHTLSHCRLRATLPEERLYQEVVTSRHVLEQKLGREVRAFAWVGGEESSLSRQAADMVRKAEYEVAFLTNSSVIRPHGDLLLLDRTNIDSSFSMQLTRFQLSGFLDMLYASKRRRIASLIGG